MLSKRLLAAAVTGLIAFGGMAAGPGPNGNNDGGLCTAYFNGQKNGHDNERAGGNGNGRQQGEAPGPFTALEAAGEEASGGEEQGAEAAYYYCMVMEGAPGIGGNPEHGRYTCDYVDTDGDGEPDDVQCTENDAPGNS